MVYRVSGYWKDNKSEFNDYLITEYDDVPKGYDDDDIFYYGLSEDDLKNSSKDDILEFVITDYEPVSKNYAKGGETATDYSGEYRDLRTFVMRNGLREAMGKKYGFEAKDYEDYVRGELGYDTEVIQELAGDRYKVDYIERYDEVTGRRDKDGEGVIIVSKSYAKGGKLKELIDPTTGKVMYAKSSEGEIDNPPINYALHSAKLKGEKEKKEEDIKMLEMELEKIENEIQLAILRKEKDWKKMERTKLAIRRLITRKSKELHKIITDLK